MPLPSFINIRCVHKHAVLDIPSSRWLYCRTADVDSVRTLKDPGIPPSLNKWFRTESQLQQQCPSASSSTSRTVQKGTYTFQKSKYISSGRRPFKKLMSNTFAWEEMLLPPVKIYNLPDIGGSNRNADQIISNSDLPDDILRSTSSFYWVKSCCLATDAYIILRYTVCHLI